MSNPASIPVDILHAFGFDASTVVIQPTGTGLINTTWKIENKDRHYILQKINDRVFKHPEAIDANLSLLGAYLQQNHPGYLFTRPVKAVNGETLIVEKGLGYYRLFDFIEGSHTIDVAPTPEQAYEAAKQFGKFTATLKNFDNSLLQTTIPHFHDLSLRYNQFSEALQKGNPERIDEAAALIAQLKSYKHITDEFEKIKTNPAFKIRVTHHDTKISNVLFDDHDKGLCVIDLDTVMPGYFISDVGDMMRTYLCPVSEEETDLSKIEIRRDFYNAIKNGYLGEMNDELSATEKQHFSYAGAFMIYMQALRFLTDYLNNDVYYGTAYPGHNLKRAMNQGRLLEKMGV